MQFFFFLLLLLLLAFIPFTQPLKPQYSNCAPTQVTCGPTSTNISYPFWLAGQPDYCGAAGHFLQCDPSNQSLTLSINNVSYQIIDPIDYQNQILHIVSSQYSNVSCPSSISNTSVSPLFQIRNRDRNLTLYINCTAPMSPVTTAIGCLMVGSGGLSSYYGVDNETLRELLADKCESTMLIPIGQETAYDLERGRTSFDQALRAGFYATWTAGDGWCSNCKSSGGYCGSEQLCFCAHGTVFGSCNPSDHFSGQFYVATALLVILPATFAASCISILGFRYRKKISGLLSQKKKSEHAKAVEAAFLERYRSLSTKRYTYANLKKITNSFSEKVGQGGYGSVYKGRLLDGRLVAVKVLTEAKGNGEDFINEVAAIINTSHVNVVSLLGFCIEGCKRALIYDFMPNGSLEKYLHFEKLTSETSLGWEKLYEISIGIARGLEYLHKGCNTRIVHFDIKPHNILLDKDFRPKISDFGMAKLCLSKHSMISMCGARGTIGYIAPEVFSRIFGAVSSKSDVYSYGMILLEMFGGKKRMSCGLESDSETYIPSWIYQHLENDNDLMEYDVSNETVEIVKKMLIVGFFCIQTTPESRPSMDRVIDMLEGSINDLTIPPKPLLSSPLHLEVDSCASSS